MTISRSRVHHLLMEKIIQMLREGFNKKNCEKAVRLTALGGEGGSPPLSLTTSICENFDPFLSFIKRQNNPKYGNLSRNFHIFLTASGEGRGGSTQAGSLTAFSQLFFLNPSLSKVLFWEQVFSCL